MIKSKISVERCCCGKNKVWRWWGCHCSLPSPTSSTHLCQQTRGLGRSCSYRSESYLPCSAAQPAAESSPYEHEANEMSTWYRPIYASVRKQLVVACRWLSPAVKRKKEICVSPGAVITRRGTLTFASNRSSR